MKIKKFNEGSLYISDRNYYPVSKKDVLDDSDFRKIHELGKKVYYLNNDNDFIECKTASELKRSKNINNSCKYILFVSEDSINNESIKGLASNTKEMEELHTSYIDNLYKLLIGAVDKIENKK